MARKVALLKKALYVSLLLFAQQSWATDCSDPAYSYLPECDKHGDPQLPSASQHEKYLEQQDTIRLNKAKLACKKKKTPAERKKCLDNLD